MKVALGSARGTTASSSGVLPASVRRRPGRAGVVLALEVFWYALVFLLIVTGQIRASHGPHEALEFHALTALAGVCALAALSRWWAPRWTGPVAVVVLCLGIVVVGFLHIGPLAPMRQMLSRAVEPVLVAAAVRRCGRWTATLVAVLALVVAACDIVHGASGFTLAADVARDVAAPVPVRGLVFWLGSAVQATLPIGVGLLLRSTDAAAHNHALAQARSEERLQVARELRDMVANHVTGIVVTAQVAGMSPDRPDEGREALTGIEAAGHRALEAMQQMVTALRSADADPDAAPAPGPDDRQPDD